MEVMDTSLDKFYKMVFDKEKTVIPEEILGKIANTVMSKIVTVFICQIVYFQFLNTKIVHRCFASETVKGKFFNGDKLQLDEPIKRIIYIYIYLLIAGQFMNVVHQNTTRPLNKIEGQNCPIVCWPRIKIRLCHVTCDDL